jgi:predicted nucleic acid-binding protein
MRLVVDANVLLSALLRDGPTRELLLHAPLDLYAPAWLRREGERHEAEIARRSDLGLPIVRSLIHRLLEQAQQVPEPVLAKHAGEALARCGRAGRKDAPYVACCLAVDAALWTQGRTLSKEAGVAVVTTRKLIAKYLA